MTHLWAYVAAVHRNDREEFIVAAREAAAMFRSWGAISVQENWEADVPNGRLTSFPHALRKSEEEDIVFGWVVWPDRRTSERCMEAVGDDPKWGLMPHVEGDGKKLLWGQFEGLPVG